MKVYKICCIFLYLLCLIQGLLSYPEYQCNEDFDANTFITFSQSLVGEGLLPSSVNFTTYTEQYNSRFDGRTPLAIVVAKSVEDVVKTVQYSRVHGHCVSIRSSGHAGSGNAVLNQRIQIDLTNLNGITLNESEMTVTAGPGATMNDLVEIMKPFNFYTATGEAGDVAVGGFYQGGGQSYGARLIGLGIDNVLSYDVVLESGNLVTASESSHQDLYWALRGGGGPGGNFGVVVSYVIRVYQAPPQILSILVIATEPVAVRAFNALQNACNNDAPPEFNPGAIFGNDGSLVIIGWYLGNPGEGLQYLDELFSVQNGFETGTVLQLSSSTNVYDSKKASFASYAGLDKRWQWKQQQYNSLSDDQLISLQNAAKNVPGTPTLSFIGSFFLSGKAAEPTNYDTAFFHRDVPHNINVLMIYENESDDSLYKDFVDNAMDSIAENACSESPVSIFPSNFMCMKGVNYSYRYQNAPNNDYSKPMLSYYGWNYLRLLKIKMKYDPDNYFHFPQSIGLE